jgi:hypothetical protein
MKTITSLLITAALATSALAGSPSTYSGKSGKGVVQPAPSQGCDCFAPGFSMGVFGGGMFPQHGGDNVAGGGVLAEYFFTENFGFQTSYGMYATSSEHHQIDGSFILRAPIKDLCIAPYLMAGGGVGTNASTRGDYHAGVGIEARFASLNCMGLFADGAYHFASGSDNDFIMARIGVKFRF